MLEFHPAIKPRAESPHSSLGREEEETKEPPHQSGGDIQEHPTPYLVIPPAVVAEEQDAGTHRDHDVGTPSQWVQ